MTRKDSLLYFSYRFNRRFILHLQHLTLLEMAQLKEGFKVEVSSLSSSFSAHLQLSTINNTTMIEKKHYHLLQVLKKNYTLLYTNKTNILSNNGYNKYKLILKAVYNKFIGLVHEHKSLTKRHAFPKISKLF